MPRATRELKGRVTRTTRLARDTGPTPAQRALVAERSGYCCEVCGLLLHDGQSWLADHSFHHRQARGMGSSKRPETNAAYNLLLLCGSGDSRCHGYIEAHRRAAEAEGWLVRHGQDPAAVPVTVHAGPIGALLGLETVRVILTEDGDYQDVAA